MRIEDLRKLLEAELMQRHNALMQRHNASMQDRVAHYNIFLDELARREAMRQGERMEALTTSINRLTWVITIATILGVLLAAVGFGG